MIVPRLAEAKALSKQYPMIPVARTMYADLRTPIEVLRVLKNISQHCFLLESLEDTTRWGRYTFLGYDPQMSITCTDGMVRTGNGAPVAFKTDDPHPAIQHVLDEYRSPRIPDLPPFCGGLVGYFSYDSIKYAEPKLDLNIPGSETFKDIDLMLFDKVIAFDHLKQQIFLIVHVKADEIEKNYKQALDTLEQMENLVRNGMPARPDPLRLRDPFNDLFDEKAYCDRVKRAKHYITEGDIFQVVLSNRWNARADGSLLDTYRVLRTTNPSPYMFYFSGDDMEIAGASPETLVKLQDGVLYTYPLAGTRLRGKTEVEDRQREYELLHDPKELAEHNMLVDLGRNDLGKISRFGSVEVEKYLSVERFSHVMHIGSTVRSLIRDDQTALDAIRAVLPAGTLSGAPKIRACEIIHELENNRRGLYGGAIGYIDLTGNMDTCIAIRIAFKKNGVVYVRSGAGIVADSVPASEHRECLSKAEAVIHALKTAEGGID